MRVRLCCIHTEKNDRKARCGGTCSELGNRKTGRAELFWAKTDPVRKSRDKQSP